MQTTPNKRSTYRMRGRRKHLANPTVDVVCVVVLTVILLLTHYLHLSMGL